MYQYMLCIFHAHITVTYRNSIFLGPSHSCNTALILS